MHGVFAAQLTIGNTSFHKLFSVSRDPYNITRASGLRILVDTGDGWRLLAVPSAFEMGLSDCRWIYRLGDRTITVRAVASGDDPAMQWRVTVEGEPCRFLVFGHLGARRARTRSRPVVSRSTRNAKRITFRPDPDSLWGQRYPDAVYHLVTSTPDAVEAIGGDELLYADGEPRQRRLYGAAHAADARIPLRGRRLDDRSPKRRNDLPRNMQRGVDDASDASRPPRATGRRVTRGLRIKGGGVEGAALDTLFPWLAHNAMIHLTVPHGLEQYTGAAWGTRDVCQGPVEFLLALEHDEPVKEILRIVFAQQYEERGDWPQWFMLEPYSIIQDTAQPRRRHRLAAQGALRLYRGDRTISPSSTSRSPGGARTTLERTARERHRRRACREAARDRARALHPRHAADPLRRGRLERFAAARRSRACATGW